MRLMYFVIKIIILLDFCLVHGMKLIIINKGHSGASHGFVPYRMGM